MAQLSVLPLPLSDSEPKIRNVLFNLAQVDEKSDFRDVEFEEALTLPPKAVSPPRGSTWLFSALLNSIKDDDDEGGKGEEGDIKDEGEQGDQSDIRNV